MSSQWSILGVPGLSFSVREVLQSPAVDKEGQPVQPRYELVLDIPEGGEKQCYLAMTSQLQIHYTRFARTVKPPPIIPNLTVGEPSVDYMLALPNEGRPQGMGHPQDRPHNHDDPRPSLPKPPPHRPIPNQLSGNPPLPKAPVGPQVVQPRAPRVNASYGRIMAAQEQARQRKALADQQAAGKTESGDGETP